MVIFCNFKKLHFENFELLISFISGPALPKTLYGHSSLSQGNYKSQGNDSFVLGGYSSTGGGHLSSSVFKFSCHNGILQWEEMEVKLQKAREHFVADFIPN